MLNCLFYQLIFFIKEKTYTQIFRLQIDEDTFSHS